MFLGYNIFLEHIQRRQLIGSVNIQNRLFEIIFVFKLFLYFFGLFFQLFLTYLISLLGCTCIAVADKLLKIMIVVVILNYLYDTLCLFFAFAAIDLFVHCILAAWYSWRIAFFWAVDGIFGMFFASTYRALSRCKLLLEMGSVMINSFTQ